MGLFDKFASVKSDAPKTSSDVEAASIAPYYSETSSIFFSGFTQATRAEAMSVPTVARSLSVMQTIASLPMSTRNIATGERVAQPRVINQPDPRIAGTVFWSWMISDLFFHPYAFARVMERYADTGKIRAILSYSPEMMKGYFQEPAALSAQLRRLKKRRWISLSIQFRR
jgi:hypothetical protein